jgi:hypothetical protein
LCTQTTNPMSVQEIHCDNCQDKIIATLECDPLDPASYQLNVSFVVSQPNSVYTIGTDIGPITPFSGFVATSGWKTLTLTYTTLSPISLPDSVTIEIVTVSDKGEKCFSTLRVPLPPCTWIAERGTTPVAVNQITSHSQPQMASAMMVFPNPSSGDVTVSYDFGIQGNTGMLLSVYDVTGKKMAQTMPLTANGSWLLSTTGWASGMYIVRMDGDGQALQVQRVIITH